MNCFFVFLSGKNYGCYGMHFVHCCGITWPIVRGAFTGPLVLWFLCLYLYCQAEFISHSLETSDDIKMNATPKDWSNLNLR